jgi:hypothetical protein
MVVVFGHSVAATSRGLRGFGTYFFALLAACLLFIGITLRALQSFPPQGHRFRIFCDGPFNNNSKYVDAVVALLPTWYWTFLLCMVWVYEVVTIKEIIRRNGVGHATSQWTYGQTFALVLVLGPVFDFGSAMWRYLGGKKEWSCPHCSTQQPQQENGEELVVRVDDVCWGDI